MKKRIAIVVLFISWMFTVSAQSDREPETDSLINARLSEWQDLKFGFMAHWGMYSQWGVVE